MIDVESDIEHLTLRYEGGVFVLTHNERRKLMLDLEKVYRGKNEFA